MQSAIGPGPVCGGEMVNVGVNVLHPGVAYQPGIDQQLGQAINAHYPGRGGLNGSVDEGQKHGRQHSIQVPFQRLADGLNSGHRPRCKDSEAM